VRAPEAEIENFPFAAHDMFYQFPEAGRNKIRVMVTARGCPYSCTYCYNYRIKEMYRGCGVKHLRHREVEGVIEEIKWIQKSWPIELIYFGTDCFTAKENWVLEFSEKYARQVRIPFTASTRPETTTVAACEALKEAGCVCVMMGIESGNQDVRLNLLNRRMTNEKIKEAADIIHKADLNLFTFNMMAFPGETVEQALDTMSVNIKCKTDYTWVSLFQPYPRTKLGEYAQEKGYFDGDYDSLPESWYNESALKNPQKKQLLRLRPLVSLGVEFPQFAWLIKYLINLPLDRLYSFIWKVHKAYAYRYRVMPVKLSFIEIVRLGWSYLFDRSQK
ncbi:radical SAM protein, partial [bacterium]|nr:radical SAM protein [bacterium]